MNAVPTILVTGAAGTLAGLEKLLEPAAVRVVRRALITFAPPEQPDALDRALAHHARYAALALTSPRAAATVAQRLSAGGGGALELPVWVAGEATARPIEDWSADIRWPRNRSGTETAGEVLAAAMLAAGTGSPVLFPCGDRRRDELPTRLRGAGIAVDEIVAYHTVLASEAGARDAISGATAVIVGSPSVARLVAAVAADPRPALIAIGPTTAREATAAGWAPDAVASEPTADAVAAEIRRWLAAAEQVHAR